MGEVKDLAKSLTILTIVSLITLVIFINPPGLDKLTFTITNYEAHLTEAGILYENFTYTINVNKQLHMLYRHWISPLYYGYLRNAGIYLLNISYKGNLSHVVPYVKTYYSGIYILNNVSYSYDELQYIAHYANKSEAGIYVPSGIPKGTYTVSYEFLLYPVLNKHGEYYHLPLDLGRGHNTYLHSRISIPASLTPEGPPYLNKEKKGSDMIYTGKIYGGFTLIFDLLFTNASGFSYQSVRNVDYDLPSHIKQEHQYDTIRYYLAYSLFIVPYYIVVLIPVAYLLVYILFGRDHARPIENEVMTPPERRSPWVVNYIFKNQGIKIDYQDVITATLLDMHRKGIIEITNGGSEIRVVNENTGDLEDYEKQILGFIKDNSQDGIMDLSNHRLKESTEVLLIDTDLENKTFEKFMYLPDKRIGYTFKFIPGYLIFAVIALIFILPYLIFMIWGFLLLIPYAIQIFAMWKFPEVLGRWNDDYYTELTVEKLDRILDTLE